MQSSQSQDSPIISDNLHDRMLITLNRPQSLNALNVAIINSIRLHLNQAIFRNLKLVFRGSGDKAFCAGGDVMDLYRDFKSDFLYREYNLFYDLRKHTEEKVAWIKGITFGGGVGLSMCCDYIVATPSTLWSMPETAIGVAPDVAASYFFSHMRYPSLGLYLSLTGNRLTGEDCYYAGIASHFVMDDLNVGELLMSRFKESMKDVLDEYHITPKVEKATTIAHLDEINKCFTADIDLNFIFLKLEELNTDWTREILATLRERCPLALKVAFQLYKRGRNMSLGDCLKMEYTTFTNLMGYNNYNFRYAIQKRLVEKFKGKLDWIPATVSEVSDEFVQQIMREDPSRRLLLSDDSPSSKL
jgi:3-hydroxyisobutyryl-CoA hydrolase